MICHDGTSWRRAQRLQEQSSWSASSEMGRPLLSRKRRGPSPHGSVRKPVASEPFVVYIRNAAKGEVAVLRGEEEIVYTDRALVGRLQRAMRRAAW